jgi:hypothetical protein
MKKPKSISELLASRGARLTALKSGAEAAEGVLATVVANLPDECRGSVWAASVADGVLTIMVSSPNEATRLHYLLPELREVLGRELGVPVDKLALKVRPAPRA